MRILRKGDEHSWERGGWAIAEETPAKGQASEEGMQEAAPSAPSYEYEPRELYARRGEIRIYGVIYIPQGAGEKMPAVIFSHGYVDSDHLFLMGPVRAEPFPPSPPQPTGMKFAVWYCCTPPLF